MKNFKHFMFAFVPSLLVIGIQYLASFFAMGLSLLVENSWYAFSDSADISTVLYDIENLWMSSDFNTGILLIYNAFSIVVFGLWYYMKYGGNYLPNPRTTFHPAALFGIVMLTPGTQYLTTYIMAFVASLFPNWMDAYEELLETAGMDENISLLMILCSVLFAPFCEELVFRGVTMKQLLKCLPFWAANLIQAVLFGIFHMNIMQGIYAACLGVILGYVCEKGGSIYYSILLHILFNFWGTVISEYIWIGDSVFSVIFWFLFGIAMTAGGLLVFYFGIRKRNARTADAAKADTAAQA
ncbi:MAG: CPBP family intramembrane metalloprotease [Roseburia sp.]|nr:CPBP family intramembrane metalloprotease [Roseburia sp.]